MSNVDNGAKANKTLAIRLEPELHAQLSIVAQLRGGTISDEIRTALEAHIDAVKQTPEFASKSAAVLEEIERDAASRREAIASLFGGGGEEDSDDEPPPARPRARRGAASDE